MAKALMKGFTIGADPELFVVDDKGRFVSAEGLIPGTKEEPYPVTGGAVQVDGMAAEFNIHPSQNFTEFNDNIEMVLYELRKMLPVGYQLVNKASVVFDEDVWNVSPDQAKILGCSPDFNAWEGSANPPPNPSDNPRMRTAAGHLHFGWTSGKAADDITHINHCNDLVKQLDYFLGLWSIIEDPDPVRRSLYGKAGACRYKHYGVEYRVLSNFWVLNPVKRLQVWDRAVSAISSMRKVFCPTKFSNLNLDVQQAINTSTLTENLKTELLFPVLMYNAD
jgi:hypothetical protein